MHALALGLLLLAGAADSVSPRDVWPQWRGPTGDSVSPVAELPTRWGPDENVVWKSPLGWGNSTPVIWQDAIFLTTQEEDRMLALRLDRKTGKVVWKHEVGKGSPRRKGPVGEGRYHDEHNMASPSPVTDGKHVWFHFGTGDLACYDFDGGQVWAVNLTKRFGPYTIWWGHANSPVLVGDLLISACMQDPKDGGQSYLVAHDKATGKERWFVQRDTGATSEPADAYTTPILHHHHDGRTDLIVFGGNVLDAYDPATGKQLWQCRAFSGNRVISGPTLAGDTVYAVQGMRGPLVAVRLGGKGDVTETHVRWKYAGSTPDAPSPAVANGLVFLATNPGIAVCVDAATGQEVWKERVGKACRASPLVAGNRVYFFSKEGKATIVEAARDFKVVSTADLGEEVIASPAVAGGDLFIRTKAHLYRIGGK